MGLSGHYRLRQLLSGVFGEGELRLLAFDLYIDYDDLPGQSKTDKIIGLISYFERRQILSTLIEYCRLLRPETGQENWEDVYRLIMHERQTTQLSVDSLLDTEVQVEENSLHQEIRGEEAKAGLLYLDGLENPYMRLAWCVNEYLGTVVNPQEDDLGIELRSLKFEVGDNESLEERADQLRTYCELYCLPYPISLIRIPSFDYFLRVIFRDYFKEKQIKKPSSSALMEALGFQNQAVFRGATILWKQILASKEQLELNTIPLDQNTIQGMGVRAFNNMEELLEYVISFYGRWIASPENPALIPGSFVEQIPNIPSGWKKLKGWSRGAWRLGVPDAIDVIERLNEVVASMVAFQDYFKRDVIISEDWLGFIKEQWKKRQDYIHTRETDVQNLSRYLDRTIEILDSILAMINYLKEDVIPPIVLIQRTLTFKDGFIRLDYINEEGILNHDRYEYTDFIIPQVESFYYSSNHDRRRYLHKSKPPIILPVTLV